MADITDIMNQALRAGGIPKRINDFYEGSEAAKVALELFGQCRDELIDGHDWAFTRRVVPLTLLKGPPPANGYNFAQPWSNIYPQPGFLYEYVYPADCIDLRAIIAPPGPMPDLDPVPANWRIDNDPTPVVSGDPPVATGPQAKVILANTTDAIAVYRGQVTDPTLWEPSFVEALVASLGKKFAVAFGASADSVKMGEAEAAVAAQSGASERG